MLELSGARISRIAYAASAVNLVAGAAMLVVLRPGLPVPGSEASRRMSFVGANRGLWIAGWLSWHAAALALVLLFVALALRFFPHAPARCALAVIASVAGLAADLAAEAVLMGVAPGLDERAFALAERGAGVLTGYLGNGLYTLAGILLTWAGAREMPRAVVALAIPLWAAGLALALSALLGSGAGAFWSTAVLMPLFVLWSALLGRWLAKNHPTS